MPGVRVAAVVPAAGRGERFGSGTPKSLVALRGCPLLLYPLRVLQSVSEIETIVVVAPAGAVDTMRALARDAGLTKVGAVVEGGADRQASVARGLASLPPGPDIILVHDGVRPFLVPSLVHAVVAAAAEDGCATAAVRVDETIKSGVDGWVRATIDRSNLYRIQTPQAFRRDVIETAHREAIREGYSGTDDAALVERLGHRVRLVPGTPMNLKVTVPEDLEVAEALLREREPKGQTPVASRIGIGYDAHRFARNRRLILGGVDIPASRGLSGHSDADAVIHAVMDALLGAAGCSDIGHLFPSDDPAYRDASSLDLLRQLRDFLARRGWQAGHVDVMILAEAPLLAPYFPAMRAAMADALGISAASVNVKATTVAGLGAIGREDGIAAHAVASLGALSPMAIRDAR
jgi:2-C-methyl-D-erythritol 4-phosphate cytidylyltransferase / 2-C-methyl-D-erythritol 2,4-cyclodiphosphate synthase